MRQDEDKARDPSGQLWELQRLLREAQRNHQRALAALYDTEAALSAALTVFAPTVPSAAADSVMEDQKTPDTAVGQEGDPVGEEATVTTDRLLRYFKAAWGLEGMSMTLSLIRDFNAVAPEDPVRLVKRSRLGQLEDLLSLCVDEAGTKNAAEPPQE
jgi:hypothetical protein